MVIEWELSGSLKSVRFQRLGAKGLEIRCSYENAKARIGVRDKRVKLRTTMKGPSRLEECVLLSGRGIAVDLTAHLFKNLPF
jgi:hypothetical protein